jgi:hypothetical protein
MKTAFSLLLALGIFLGSVRAADRAVLFREEFRDLRNWQDLFFPGISSHSSYTVDACSGSPCLKAESNASASALIHTSSFDVRAYPRARWRWKIENIYRKGDARKKAGDDYPLRIYILFEYRPEQAGGWERVQYALARALYGQYPPHSSLSYVWANREEGSRVLASPYTDRARMVLLQEGASRAGTWQDEEVDLLADYRAAFGADPPERARVAIMNDSDDTGERSVSWLEYIEVYGEKKD